MVNRGGIRKIAEGTCCSGASGVVLSSMRVDSWSDMKKPTEDPRGVLGGLFSVLVRGEPDWRAGWANRLWSWVVVSCH